MSIIAIVTIFHIEMNQRTAVQRKRTMMMDRIVIDLTTSYVFIFHMGRNEHYRSGNKLPHIEGNEDSSSEEEDNDDG